jgi:hypothetical protein
VPQLVHDYNRSGEFDGTGWRARNGVFGSADAAGSGCFRAAARQQLFVAATAPADRRQRAGFGDRHR